VRGIPKNRCYSALIIPVGTKIGGTDVVIDTQRGVAFFSTPGLFSLSYRYMGGVIDRFLMRFIVISLTPELRAARGAAYPYVPTLHRGGPLVSMVLPYWVRPPWGQTPRGGAEGQTLQGGARPSGFSPPFRGLTPPMGAMGGG
jgi:hypothetical protein